MQVLQHLPDRRLSPYVRSYRARRAEMGAAIFRRPLPARSDVILEFYFTTPHMIELKRSGARALAPWAVFVGPQTFQRVDLILSGHVDVFTVVFTPTGLHALFGVPMTELADAAIEAEHLFGAQAGRELHERLAHAGSLAHRAQLLDAELLKRMPAFFRDPVAQAARRIDRCPGLTPVRVLAAASGVSERQFRRDFLTRVGITPKLYSRIQRLNAALDAKTADPATTWTDLAHRFGWFDQAHLDKDFLDLAGAAPSVFFARLPG